MQSSLVEWLEQAAKCAYAGTFWLESCLGQVFLYLLFFCFFFLFITPYKIVKHVQKAEKRQFLSV